MRIVAGNVAAEDFRGRAAKFARKVTPPVAVVAADPRRRFPLVLLAFAVHGVAPVAEPSALVPGGREEGGGRGQGRRGSRAPPSRSADANRRGGFGFQEETGQPTRIGEAVSAFRRKPVSRPENANETEPNRGVGSEKSRGGANPGEARGTHRMPQALHSVVASSAPAGVHPFLHMGVSCGGGVGEGEHVGVVSARFASRRGRAEPSRAGSKPPRRSVVRRRRRCRRGARGARRAGRRRGRTVRVHAALAHVVPMFSRRRRLEREARRRERGARARVEV